MDCMGWSGLAKIPSQHLGSSNILGCVPCSISPRQEGNTVHWYQLPTDCWINLLWVNNCLFCFSLNRLLTISSLHLTLTMVFSVDHRIFHINVQCSIFLMVYHKFTNPHKPNPEGRQFCNSIYELVWGLMELSQGATLTLYLGWLVRFGHLSLLEICTWSSWWIINDTAFG